MITDYPKKKKSKVLTIKYHLLVLTIFPVRSLQLAYARISVLRYYLFLVVSLCTSHSTSVSVGKCSRVFLRQMKAIAYVISHSNMFLLTTPIICLNEKEH